MQATSARRSAATALLAVLAALTMALATVGLPLAAAAESFSFELEKQIIFGEPGGRYDLGTYSTPESLVGATCTVEAIGNNNESVHIGNNIEVASVNTVTLLGVEDASDKDTFADGPLTLSDTVSFTLVLGEDPVYSAEFLVVFDCPSQETTTTTQPETTTTTQPETTTTTQPEVTTTTQPEATTTTTIPVTTTTVGPTGTTAPPEVQATTTVPDTLPYTGVESEHLAMVAFAALLAGAGLLLATRKNAEAGEII